MELTKEEAIKFFAAYYDGAHHIPGFEPKQFGPGWFVSDDRGDIASYDFSKLTKLVVLAHDMCIRVSIMPNSARTVKIAVHKREREGSQSKRHPTLEEAVAKIREFIHG